MEEAKSPKEFIRIRAHNLQFLDFIDCSLETVLGFKKKSGKDISQQPAIIVFGSQKINPKWISYSQLIPKKLKGSDELWCALDVVEAGKFKSRSPPL